MSKLSTLWKVVLILSLLGNVLLGIRVYQLSNKPEAVKSVEEASEIQNFQYGVPCNTVFGYQVCTSDFVGLDESDAVYKARTHGLEPVITTRDGKVVRAYVLEDQQPFRINFKLENEVVTEAYFQ